MKKAVFEDFDGYAEIAAAIEHSRKFGVDYTAEGFSPDACIRRLHPASLRLKVVEVLPETPQARTLRLACADGPLPAFQAGQYVALCVEVGGVRTSRPYSISSPPHQTGYYDLTVQRVKDGFVSNYLLDEVKKGDVLTSSGPAGEFVYNPLFHFPTQVFLAGGSGVTPFLSMIRETLECGLDRKLILFHGSRTLAGAIRFRELSGLAERFADFRYVPVLEKPGKGWQGRSGYITGELLREELGDPDRKTFYLCGPQGMYDFCMPQLEALGIPRKRLRKEMYGLPAKIWQDPGWPRKVKKDTVFQVRVRGAAGAGGGGGVSLESRAGEPLLAALEKAGVLLPSQCRCGECSLCRVRLVAGRVFQPAGVKLRKSDRQFGYIHSCAAFPLTDLVVEV